MAILSSKISARRTPKVGFGLALCAAFLPALLPALTTAQAVYLHFCGESLIHVEPAVVALGQTTVLHSHDCNSCESVETQTLPADSHDAAGGVLVVGNFTLSQSSAPADELGNSLQMPAVPMSAGDCLLAASSFQKSTLPCLPNEADACLPLISSVKFLI